MQQRSTSTACQERFCKALVYLRKARLPLPRALRRGQSTTHRRGTAYGRRNDVYSKRKINAYIGRRRLCCGERKAPRNATEALPPVATDELLRLALVRAVAQAPRGGLARVGVWIHVGGPEAGKTAPVLANAFRGRCGKPFFPSREGAVEKGGFRSRAGSLPPFLCV